MKLIIAIIKPFKLDEVREALSGIGGITSGEDVAEFLLAGASCVQVGTQSFAEPGASARIVRELADFLRETGATSARELVGALDTGGVVPPSCVR